MKNILNSVGCICFWTICGIFYNIINHGRSDIITEITDAQACSLQDKCYDEVVDPTANPAPLGFFGLGFAATFLGLMAMGAFTDSIMVIAMSVTLGGFAQLIAGLQLWKKGDTFGATAFTAFALWWFSFAYILLTTSVGLFGNVVQTDPSFATSLGWYLLFWGIIATLLTIVTLKIGVKSIIVTFVFLDLTFFTNAAVNFGITIGSIAGLITFLLGLSSLYTGMAIVMDEVGGIKVPY